MGWKTSGWLVLAAWASACGTTTADDADTDTDVDTETDTVTQGTSLGIDPTLFASGALAADVTTEPCTLSGGTQTTCYRIAITGVPADHAVGPFCPRTTSDGADVAGLWMEGGETFDLTGVFITGLADFYGDDNWLLYDPKTGDVRVTDTQVACEAAARPDVDPAYQNYCVECSLDYMTTSTTVTFLLPVTPVKRTGSAQLDRMGKVGVSLSGVVFDPPAPVDAILGAYTIAALDDCGGHVNLHTGYHYHAATGCSHQVAQADAHAPLLGYAMDGYGMYARLDPAGDEPDDLDTCRGHSDDVRGYHYHVASAGQNAFIGCLSGESGSVL